MQVIGTSFRGLSGRIDDFIFRTHKTGKISVQYRPRKQNMIPKTDRDWTENGPIMNRLEKILTMFDLKRV